MRIYGLICICPECRHVSLYQPTSDGTFNLSPLACAADGYMMKIIKVDSFLIDRLLKGEDVNASFGATGT
jgi:hypothetical protein